MGVSCQGDIYTDNYRQSAGKTSQDKAEEVANEGVYTEYITDFAASSNAVSHKNGTVTKFK
jgi:hypothetical protein